VLEPFDPAALAIERGYLELDVDTELRRFAAIRADHVALLESLDDAGWNRTGIHGEHGRMTVERYETHVAAEDVDHLAQIARLRA
ncbi:MAG TPA: DinB family protein, partial [Patescibacteria group bacterium]|nr:DinB family protein [Patescibacteria group bacterium]